MWQTPIIPTPALPDALMNVCMNEVAEGSVKREAVEQDADTSAAEPGREVILEAALAARASLYRREVTVGRGRQLFKMMRRVTWFIGQEMYCRTDMRL